MTGRRMSIGAMRGCECGEHVWLLLHEHEGGTHIGLRVHTQLGKWFDPAEEGVTRLIEGVTSILRAAGREPTAVIVTHDAERRVRVRVRVGGAGETDVECEPGVALLLAERTRLPIFLQDGEAVAPEDVEAEPAIPEVYRETLTALGLLADASD
ncbi:MAG: hypothetical protein OXH97_00580 [Chloroflexota bacterium]|nr:hypothetical protein [Chloroflexota bacterium]